MVNEISGDSPAFRITAQRNLTLEEVTDLFGDPLHNTHQEEGSGRYLELISDVGEPYRVNLGLPKPTIGAYGAVKYYEAPYSPHVFNSDRFILKSGDDPNKLLIDAPRLRILQMHGRWDGKNWVPSDQELANKGLSVPRLISAFEKLTGWPIDVVWVCQFDSEQGRHPLETDTGHPYIYPISGYAQGAVMLERGKLEVSLNQAPDEISRIEYEDWLTAFSGLTSI